MIKNRFYLAIILFLFFGYFAFSLIFGAIFNNNISVEGTLKKYNDDNAVVEYFIDGEKKWYKMYGVESYEDGEKIVLEYEKNDINNVTLSKKNNSAYGIGMLIVVLLLVSPIIYDYIIYCNIIKNGTKIEVEYVDTETIINGSASFYEMKFKWVNPENDETYYLTNSDFVKVDPRDIIKERNITKFVAYINLKKPNQHRVILDNLLTDVYLNKEKFIMM